MSPTHLHNCFYWIRICFMYSCCSEIHFLLPKWTKPSHARLSLNMANGAIDFYEFVLVQCFWHFASRLVSRCIFSTFCRLEKEARGQSKGFISLQNTHICKDTHFHSSLCPRLTSSHGQMRCLVSTSAVWVLVTFQSALQPEINTIAFEQLDGWHLCIVYVFADVLFTLNVPTDERQCQLQWHGEGDYYSNATSMSTLS